MRRESRSPAPHHYRKKLSFMRAIVLIVAAAGAFQLCRQLSSHLFETPVVEKVCNCTVDCPLAVDNGKQIASAAVQLPPPSPCPLASPPPCPICKDIEDEKSEASALSSGSLLDSEEDDDDDGGCKMQPLVEFASKDYKFTELSTFLQHTELLFGGISAGSKYSFTVLGRNQGQLNLDYGFPTAAMSEAVALHASNSTKLCLLKAWLDSWAQHKENQRIRVALSPSLFQSLGQMSFLYPQGYYFSGAKAKGPLLYERYRGIDPERPMAFRSQSKALTSATILALQDKGLLNINDKVSKYLPEYGEDFVDRLTIRMVMMHAAGATRYNADNRPTSKDPPSMRLHNITMAESARLIAKEDISFTPGEFLYTAIAYQILGAIAEKVTGKSWHKIFQEYLAEPTGMTNTQWYSFYSNVYPAANPLLAVGAVGSPRDFERFARMLMNKGEAFRPDGSSVRVLSVEAVEDMMTIQNKTVGSITTAFGQLNKASVQQIHQMGFLSETTANMSRDTWETTVGYGLGLWIVVRNESDGRSVKHIHLAGMYNSHAMLFDFGTPQAVFAQGFAFTKFDGTWSIPGVQFYKAVHGIEDSPESKRKKWRGFVKNEGPVLDLQSVFNQPSSADSLRAGGPATTPSNKNPRSGNKKNTQLGDIGVAVSTADADDGGE